VSAAAGIADAYSHCESVTRTQAANFFYGIRLLPGQRRRAMSAVYAFARRVDDIGDGALERGEKLRLLDVQAQALAAIALNGADAARGGGIAGGRGLAGDGGGWRAGPTGADPVMLALADAQRHFPLPVDALGELVEGVRMDVDGVEYESFEDLLAYCRRVAGGIGRLCLAIFGLREHADADADHAERLAEELGVALQLTNILRDLREDADNARVYLPAEDLRRFGVLAGEHEAGQVGAADTLAALARRLDAAGGRPFENADALARLSALVRFESERAARWFDRGIVLAGMLDRRSAACVLAMAGIYRRLLARIDAHPEEAMRRRISLPAHEKAWVAARGMIGVGR
jgi:phytoene synthase